MRRSKPTKPMTALELFRRIRGTPVRPKQVHRDKKKEQSRRACRKKHTED